MKLSDRGIRHISKRKRAIIISAVSVVVILAVCFVGCGIYLGDFYRADSEAIAAYMDGKEMPREYDDGSIRTEPDGAKVGFIFYPGGKVEHTAYVPLMQALAEEGILTVTVKMPFKLAVLDVNAADGIREEYPEIEKWYIGGHSLGGSMAASYLAKNYEGFEGIILLGSYSTAKLADLPITAISIYGSEDGVLNREKYAECKANLPSGYTELVLEGGSHAYFGAYGEQSGDGIAKISREEQIAKTAEAISKHVFSYE